MLRYYEELGIDDIAATLGISPNSVKTHLKRGLAAMGTRLGITRNDTDAGDPGQRAATQAEEVGA